MCFIVALVQERLHSTSLGVDAAFTFLLQVIEELHDAVEERSTCRRENIRVAWETNDNP